MLTVHGKRPLGGEGKVKPPEVADGSLHAVIMLAAADVAREWLRSSKSKHDGHFAAENALRIRQLGKLRNARFAAKRGIASDTSA